MPGERGGPSHNVCSHDEGVGQEVIVVRASVASLAIGSRLCPLHDAARRSEPYQAHIRSPLNGCTIIPLAAGTGLAAGAWGRSAASMVASTALVPRPRDYDSLTG